MLNVSLSALTRAVWVVIAPIFVLCVPSLASAAGSTIQFAAALQSVDESAGTATVAVERTGDPVGAASVYYKTPGGGTAQAREDFIGVTGVLAWQDGDGATQTFEVPIIDDSAPESAEYFTLELSSPLGSTVGVQSSIRVTIVDNDVQNVGSVQFAASTMSVDESVGNALVTVSRSPDSVGTATAYYKTLGGGTAASRQDFVGVTGTLIWGVGDTSDKKFEVPIVDDTEQESSEYFSLELSGPTGSKIGTPKRLQVTIVDNDGIQSGGTVQFSAAVQEVDETSQFATVVVTRVGGTAGAITAYYKTLGGGTAQARQDFQGVTGALVWADGSADDQTFLVPIVNDQEQEGAESFKMELSTPFSSALGTPNVLEVRIIDDESLIDTDGDGVADGDDNCPAVANAGQFDFDQNDIGDACESGIACPPAGTSVAAVWTGYLEAGADPLLDTDVDVLQFDVPANCNISSVGVEITWANSIEDLDLYVADAAGVNTVSSANANVLTGASEYVSLSDPAGAYNAQIVGYTSIGTQYQGRLLVNVSSSTGGSAQCDAAFSSAAAGLSAPAVDPAMPWGQAGRMVLSFPDALARRAAYVKLSAAVAESRLSALQVFEFKHLPQLVVRAELIERNLLAAISSELSGSQLISIWSGEKAIKPLVDESVAYIGVDLARDAFGTDTLPLTGKGVGVAVIDTGLDTLQGDFPAERIKENVRVAGDPFGFLGDGQGVEFISLPNTELSSNGHGTHISGTIMGSGAMSEGLYDGVAPGADLVHLAVEYGSYIYTLAAMDHILDIRDEYNIRVTNHSYGPVDPDSDPVEPGVQPHRFDAKSASAIAIKAMYDAGVIAVFAAGNSGPGDDTMSGDSQNPCAIGVASGRKNGTLSNFSSRGVNGDPTIQPDITAPGEAIVATRAANAVVSPVAGGNPLPQTNYPYYVTMSGTSMAAPHVVGAIAILLEANPALNFGQVLSIIQDTARSMPGYSEHEVGVGYLDVFSALADPRVLNQTLVDTDGDGVIDVLDNCPSIPNASQSDLDQDGVGDACDSSTPSQCDVPGLPMVIDARGDYDPSGTGIASTGGNDNQDLVSVHLSQPFAASGVQTLEFRLQIASLEQLQPGSAYFVTFIDPANASNYRGVRMEVAPDLTTAFYTYVPSTSNGGTSDGRFVASKALTSGSYDAQTGEIVFVVEPSELAIDLVSGKDTLAGFLAGISQTDPAASGTLTFMPDSAPDDLSRVGSFTVQPNAYCDADGDTDGDGVLNQVDNCPQDPNADQSDIDNDMAGDACDADMDGDGVANGQDAFPEDATEWTDTDGDQIGDNADTDDDNDGAEDSADNCPLDYNPLQEDSDNDGYGDACDAPPPPACADGLDNDGDGWVDGLDAGCSSASDDDESDLGLTQCSDGVDNDDVEDSLIDANDPDCANGADDDESAPVVTVVPRVVVSVIDSAINMYHDIYYANGSQVTTEILDEIGVPLANRNISLTRTGNLAADMAADAALWAGIQWGQMYHFAGTNVIAVSYAGANGDGVAHPPLKPQWYGDDDPRNKSPHGVGTSSSVLIANPEAIILFVETDGDLGNNNAHELAYRNPAVDIVSTSYGIALAGVVGVLPEARSAYDTYNGVVNNGKLHFTSAGNNPGITPLSGGAGPWWSIGVGGLEEDNFDLVGALLGDANTYDGAGQQIMAGNFPDFVGDYSQPLPYCMDCESDINGSVPGTSFSTPRAAGTASKVLLEARRASGHAGGIQSVAGVPVMIHANGKTVSNWVLRRALEEAAWVPAMTDHSSGNQIIWESTTLPVNAAAPWLQVGWGALTPDPAKGVVSGALAHLGYTGNVREKEPGYCEFQTELLGLRHVYWDEVAPLVPFNYTSNSDRIGHSGPDPFVYCNSLNPLHPAGNDPGQLDSDADGVSDARDNCPQDGNADQADANGNGIGDVCDSVQNTTCTLPNGPYVVEWNGTVGPAAVVPGPSGEDVYTVTLPENCNYDAATVSITWDVLWAEDLDLEVTKPGGATEEKLTGDSGSESLTLTPPIVMGAYEVRTFGFTSASTEYHGEFTANVVSSVQIADADSDGVADSLDNCISTPNADQSNIDGDAYGDACDGDRDGDGFDNSADAFPDDMSEWADSDGDGVGDNSDPFPNDPTQGGLNGARVVVAVIDTGINPYHEFYYAGSRIYPSTSPNSVNAGVLAEFGIGAACQLTVTRTGNFAADYAADVSAGLWATASACDMVWFKGTNIIAKSFEPNDRPYLADSDSDAHGVGTSAAALEANPEAVLLFVEGGGRFHTAMAPAWEFLFPPSDAEAWTFTHPAVDIVSTSYGNTPLISVPSVNHNVASFEGVFGLGKLHFGAADNNPTLSPADGTSGPWWTIAIAGVEEGTSNGAQMTSGRLVDFVGDFTQDLPYCGTCESGTNPSTAGTSFATPRSAGTASKVLLSLRRSLGHGGGIDVPSDGSTPMMAKAGGVAISNWQIRRALEVAAWVPGVESYDPIEGTFDFFGAPIPAELGFTVAGWGVISPSAGNVVGHALDFLGYNDGTVTAVRTKSIGYCEFQTAIISERKLWWDTLALQSATFLNAPSPDPFVYCDE